MGYLPCFLFGQNIFDAITEKPEAKPVIYLYWEGRHQVDYDFSQGFCVAGADSAAFLEKALAKLGLTRREANESIVCRLPQLEAAPYNLIASQSEAYTEGAQLFIEPASDTLLRVFMAWNPLQKAVDIPAQDLRLLHAGVSPLWNGAAQRFAD